MSLDLVPDAERLLVRFYQAQPEVAAVLGDRIYSALPAQPAWPVARVVRWGGWAIINRPFVLDEAWCQVETWGGRKAEASAIARLLRQLADERLAAAHPGVVTHTRLGMLNDTPDTSYEPARPHFRFDLSLMLRPTREPDAPVPVTQRSPL